tara:strand:- start:44 stop:913 length:870 start_codon:yes stop_codon:yes gene_type:complete
MSYITFSSLGSSGGMCSQLQSYASSLAVAKANNKQLVFSKSMFNEGCGIKIFDLLEIEPILKPDSFFKNFQNKLINFHTTKYDETLFNLNSDINYDLSGRFDLYTYWYNDIGNEVKSWLFNKKSQDKATQVYKNIKENLGDKPTVSIHIRKGDYTLPQNKPLDILDSDYYLNAIIKHFQPIKDYNFIVFSNDIEYAKAMLEGDNIWFVEPKGIDAHSYTSSEKDDLALLSLCDNHIIANSSYSWWGAFLSKNKNKKVICPTNWLISNHESAWINGNYFPKEWINIDNKN